MASSSLGCGGIGASARSSTTAKPALLKQSDYLQRMQLRTAGLLAYPFNRGLRVELSAGVRHAMYHRELRSQISSAATGRVLATERVTSSGGEPTTVAEVGAALVHDTTVFGLTGPLLGSRYRFEIAPAVGDLSYTRVLADYRRYLMPVRPYSLAVRVLHSARYGPDGDDPRLLSSFLGSTSFVRGHRLDLRYCPPDPTRVCGDELLGSRLLVSNVEVRFPLWGIFSRQLDYGRLPADAFLFADGGLVWSGARPLGVDSAPARDHGHQQHRWRHPIERRRSAVRGRGDSRARRSAAGVAVRLRIPSRVLIGERTRPACALSGTNRPELESSLTQLGDQAIDRLDGIATIRARILVMSVVNHDDVARWTRCA